MTAPSGAAPDGSVRRKFLASNGFRSSTSARCPTIEAAQLATLASGAYLGAGEPVVGHSAIAAPGKRIC